MTRRRKRADRKRRAQVQIQRHRRDYLRRQAMLLEQGGEGACRFSLSPQDAATAQGARYVRAAWQVANREGVR